MTYEHLQLTAKGDVLTIAIHRPNALNALNAQIIDEIDKVLTEVKNDNRISLIIFTGTGEKSFCAGADLHELQDLSYFEAKRLLEKGQSVFRKIELLDKPSIAAVNGYALGGGFELALACSIRVASSNAKFALPEVKLGMIPGYGGTQRLPRLIGKAKALELLLTGKRFGAEEAKELGIVTQVVEPDHLLTAAAQLADEILENSQVAISLVLQAVERGLDLSMEHALALETTLDAAAIASEEQREGLAAFMEKRKPFFRKNVGGETV